MFGKDWYDAIVQKRELEDDRDWLRSQIGQQAEDVAVALTRRWQSVNPPKVRKPAEGIDTNRANGRVLRVLRRQDHALLLIYPIAPPLEVVPEVGPAEPIGLDLAGPPIIGIALSFPTSATALGVEYRVNKVWGAEIEEDAEYAD